MVTIASRESERARKETVRKFRVGILGATGTVGQRFIQLLENHPQFAVTALAASDGYLSPKH
jgi:N-acetyl-gamma-glutamylphosphate reductase